MHQDMLFRFELDVLPAKLIGRSPDFFSSFAGRWKELTLLPKKLPIPEPMPPRVARMSTGTGAAGCSVAGGFEARSRSAAASRSLKRVLTSVRTPSKALNKLEDPVARAEEIASRAGASFSSIWRSCNPSDCRQLDRESIMELTHPQLSSRCQTPR
jgi:hypothetical protein